MAERPRVEEAVTVIVKPIWSPGPTLAASAVLVI
jgi:hypothetical protein